MANKSLPITAASVKFEAAEAEGGVKVDRFNMLAYTGGPMDLEGWRLPVVVDIEGMRVPKSKRPVLLNHDHTQIVGHTDEVTKLNGQLVVKGVASGASAATQQVSASSKQGFPWQASIGAAAKRWVEVKEGKTARANGREHEGPVFIVRQSVLGEISFVPLGADGDTEAKFAAKKRSSRKESSMDFEAFVESLGLVASDLSDEQTVSFKKIHAAQVKASAGGDGSADGDGEGGGTTTKTKPAKAAKSTETDSDDDEDDSILARRKKAAAEEQRLEGIREIAAKFPKLNFAAKAMSEGWSLKDTELHAMRESMPKAPAIAGSGSSNGYPSQVRAIEASILLESTKIPEKRLREHFKSDEIEAAMSKDYRRLGLNGLIHLVCAQNGVHLRPGRIDRSDVDKIIAADRRIRASATASSLSLDGVLGNVANKLAMDSFNATSRTVNELCGVQSLNDFKTHTRYRVTASGVLEKIGPLGEIKHANLTEESFTSSLDTFAKMLVLSRQDIINDDLNVFTDNSSKFGRMSALAVEKEFYTLLLANTGTFFATGNGNYQEGAATTLDVAGLTTAVKLFYNQKDSAGYPVSIMPNRILVPTGLMVPAQQLFADEYFSVPTANTKKESIHNPHRGQYTPIVSPWLNNQSLSGGSELAWYLFADPSVAPAFMVSYLNGNQTPVIESSDADFNTLGMAWRCYFDFGISQGDKRFGVKSKGEA